MQIFTPQRRRLVAAILLTLLVSGVAAGLWLHKRWQASLPRLEGRATVAGLQAPVQIERDQNGVPTIRGRDRTDVTRALGFLHAQERFFQMDFTRRRAAGELAEIFGEAALPLDEAARMHDFRGLAGQVLAQLPARERELLEAYTSGVNAGLNDLGAAPFEYTLLRVSPQPWRAEDCVLIVYAMTLDLQDSQGEYEQTLGALRDQLGAASLAFFSPLVGPNDVALDESTAPLAPIPGPGLIDLRRQAAADSASAESARWVREARASGRGASNAFAVAATHTSGQRAIVENDMHLSLRVPNTWYRAALAFVDPQTNEPAQVTGVTLPGTPAVVAGSNGRIAWGLTNSYADVSDLVVVELTSLETVYVHGQMLPQIEKRAATIQVKGGDPVVRGYDWTVWGPIVGKNAARRPLALRWVAHEPAATNFRLLDLEAAGTVEEAVAIAHEAGIPAQNFVVADRHGKIGWTIAGKLPKRVGFDGRVPMTWAYGDRRWEGFLPTEAVPTLIAPASGWISTANQRLLGGEGLKQLGDGGYELPERAARLRDLLRAEKPPGEADLWSMALDDRAPHLDAWHQLLKRVLSDEAVAQRRERGTLRETIGAWDGRAQVESASYRLVRAFERQVEARVLGPIFARCRDVYPNFSSKRLQYRAALWRLLEQKPAHLLAPAYASWDALLLAAADDVLAELDEHGVEPHEATWGAINVANIRHVMSGALPVFLARRLDMPREPLAGDDDTPRVQGPAFGASQRFVVSPGHEAEGYFNMPGGQSGHALSPYFRSGHASWVRGEKTPFLPGPPRYLLELLP